MRPPAHHAGADAVDRYAQLGEPPSPRAEVLQTHDAWRESCAVGVFDEVEHHPFKASDIKRGNDVDDGHTGGDHQTPRLDSTVLTVLSAINKSMPSDMCLM
jgi:hypothetical protein